ncbi:MAG: tRNA (adenosine(37)-N6)-threonylcarbamoyltransferase complex transferase subunit TsaD [SAR116 cluster bacterium]|nr:tRNA (adenosine(37)-N6)-threonylcarbamoyltransferase complex transferase subunit TsaD [Paracoccaceae bacterium]RCL78206.1 MAG: tRNA (adenosine(37)-N6)-threonylcarbamoyltransferase complex transferase subunit TsaD [SAR116 cluster bacterium]RPH13846.1 MAG: tRNA (adenosine(37)-N6)-threonylcarbamoyltransferase complex transferase subunit TsaD [Alphaproteobacteria bacterium TMED150]HBQ22558.1 tRNA (adenosine(37)-N6)-threonylcarbamoyltransferase complex transferase subunit TsaD [Alphaproteobacteria|tara:strand:+ start:1474 stop:2505 length:1032 start_codon:yes stop_codon:yes gene_type:complete
MRILGFETSCDETAVALVEGNPPGPGTIIHQELYSQLLEHKAYSGVVPEIAARAHLDRLDQLVAKLFEATGIGFNDLDGIAVTSGPGLAGGVLVGLMYAKALAQAQSKSFIAVNHLEAHGLTPRLSHGVAFPYWLLLVSGGHSQILEVRGPRSFIRHGTTIDDAAGEAFDKVAKMMGLGYPGGPAIERLASQGRDDAVELPRPLMNKSGCDFSFSGLKTAVRRHLEQGQGKNIEGMADLAASFQKALGDCLIGKLESAVFDGDNQMKTLVVAGGVARNLHLRARLDILASKHGLELICPPLELCSDNAAMIGWAGIEMLHVGFTDSLDVPAQPRWPLRSEQYS